MSQKNLTTKVKMDWQGYACAGGDVIDERGYLWFGDGERCYTHTTSLRSLRGLRDLCDKLIKAREKSYARRKRKKRG